MPARKSRPPRHHPPHEEALPDHPPDPAVRRARRFPGARPVPPKGPDARPPRTPAVEPSDAAHPRLLLQVPTGQCTQPRLTPDAPFAPVDHARPPVRRRRVLLPLGRDIDPGDRSPGGPPRGTAPGNGVHGIRDLRLRHHGPPGPERAPEDLRGGAPAGRLLGREGSLGPVRGEGNHRVAVRPGRIWYPEPRSVSAAARAPVAPREWRPRTSPWPTRTAPRGRPRGRTGSIPRLPRTDSPERRSRRA